MASIKTPALATLFTGMLLSSCTQSNNILIGRVEATAGSHTIVVTDCYRTGVDPPKTEIADGVTTYSYAPCRDAQILIRGDQLTVNGQSYGRIGPTDSILVDHGVVSHASSKK